MTQEFYEKKIKELENIIANQKLELENKNITIKNQELQIQHYNRIIFGHKRESAAQIRLFVDGEQLSLFLEENGNEKLKEEIEKESENLFVKSYERKKKSKKSGLKKEIEQEIPVEYIHYSFTEEQLKIDNEHMWKKIGEESVGEKIKFIPAKLVREITIRDVYKKVRIAPNVKSTVREGCDALEIYEKPEFDKAEIPLPVLSHTFVTPSLMAEVIYQKYNMGVPLYRQEKMWDDKGLILPRNVMANWIIKVSEYYLNNLQKLMLKTLKEENKLLHMDETTIQCNKEDGKKASTKSYMWVITSGKDEDIKGTIFRYNSSRKASIAVDMLKDFKGTLVTDGYAAYDKIENIKHAECWAHCRRYFYESIPLNKDKELTKDSVGYIGVEYCDKLFKIEREIANFSVPEKLEKRNEKSKPLTKEFFEWLENCSKKEIINKKLKKAVTYAINQKKELQKFLEDGNIPLSNSLVERRIRPFAVHRKNWLFSDSPAGAEASGVIYSLVESAKQNDLDVWKYFEYLFKNLPQLNIIDENNDSLKDYLPWSKKLPSEIRKANTETSENKDINKNIKN